MPMQPSPKADTSKPLFPNLRFCIFCSCFKLNVGRSPLARSRQVLLVGDLFQPVDGYAVQRFLNGDMGHRGCRARAMPMFLAGRKPDDIPRPDFLDGAAKALRPAAA